VRKVKEKTKGEGLSTDGITQRRAGTKGSGNEFQNVPRLGGENSGRGEKGRGL